MILKKVTMKYINLSLYVLKRFTRTKTLIPIKLPPTKQLIIITTLVPGSENVKTFHYFKLNDLIL